MKYGKVYGCFCIWNRNPNEPNKNNTNGTVFGGEINNKLMQSDCAYSFSFPPV
jgi:hypothetical protein